MTGLPGGAADKSGNAYEQLWTASRVADLLRGEASRLKLEPPGDDGLGIEFELDALGRTWGEQAKHSASTWTVKRLRSQGVLSSAKHQIERGLGFRLITSSAATALDQLTGRARLADSLESYIGLLSKKLQPDFEEVAASWGLEQDDARVLLRSIFVEQHTRPSLLRNTRQAFEILYAGDPELAIAAVQRYCEAHMHEDIRAPQIAAHLEGAGLHRRLLAGDEDSRRKLHLSLERHQRRVTSTTPAFGLVHRPEAQRIIDDLLTPENPRIVLVDAPAGYGKSVVVSEVAAGLDERGWYVAVARMDVDVSVPTSGHLGAQMGLADSPAVLLNGVADGAAGLLVIDQLDAISLFSGRMPDSFEAVDEVLAEIGPAENLKALLVVRTVDLVNDPRLHRYVVGAEAVSRHTLERLDRDLVLAHLAQHGVDVPSHDTVELLRIPLHLAVYARLSDTGRRLPFRTLQDLYDQLTPEVRRRATGRAGHLDWAVIVSFMLDTMSAAETLVVPRATLDRFRVEELAALESEGILVGDESTVGFFHETYFDYLFSRTFAGEGRDLHAFLADSGQFLFRRSQTRQVLEYLAATDRSRFREVAAQLLASSSIRSHLKHVVVSVLWQILPEPEDWTAIEEIAWSDRRIGPHLLGLLSNSFWFDVADRLHRWEVWLADEGRVDRAARQLAFAARDRGRRTAELVGPYVGTSEDWRLRLRTLVSWSLNPDLVPLAIDLIELGALDDARGPIAANSDFWSVLHLELSKEDPAGAARLIGAVLNRGLKLARAQGSEDPFESGHLTTNSPSGSVIREVARQAPATFIEDVLPFVVSVAQANQDDVAERLPTGRRWRYRWRGSERSVDAVVFAATEDALCELAASDPEAARLAIGVLRDIQNAELRFLVCRALAVLGDSDDAISWMLSDPRNFILGWANSPRWASRELIGAHSSGCSDVLHAELEAALLAHRSTDTQHALLSKLDPLRMSELAKRRVAELERRFESPPPEPAPVMASFVGPPIPVSAAARMSDDNWLSGLRKHSAESTKWRGSVPIGGASQLAQVLEERAKEEPERFARLALRFDSGIPATAGAHVLRGVHASLGPALLSEICEHLAGLYQEEVGRDVCSAIEAAKEVNERLIALLDQFSTSNSPDREWAGAEAAGGDKHLGGDLLTAGLNSTRGGAALAAAAILFRSADHLESILPIV